jgi:hypothetical protein
VELYELANDEGQRELEEVRMNLKKLLHNNRKQLYSNDDHRSENKSNAIYVFILSLLSLTLFIRKSKMRW